MPKIQFIALLVFAGVLSTAFAAETKGTLVIGTSQHFSDASICLNGQPTCHGLRKLEQDEERVLEQNSNVTGVLVPANATSGTPEMVCFGPFPERCYGWYVRRLQDVFDEHRRLEVTGDSELKDIVCSNEKWGLHCN